MRRETAKYLYDIQSAALRLQDFTSGKSFADYRNEAMLRSAVEREFIVIGEAINQLARSSVGDEDNWLRTHHRVPQRSGSRL